MMAPAPIEEPVSEVPAATAIFCKLGEDEWRFRFQLKKYGGRYRLRGGIFFATGSPSEIYCSAPTAN